jgi:hypothetical protein
VFTDAAGAPDGAALDVGMAVAPGLGLTGGDVGGGLGLTGGDVGGGLGLGLTDPVGVGVAVGVDVGLELGLAEGFGDGGQVEDGAGPAGSGIGASRLMLNFESAGASGQPGLFNHGFFNWRAPAASARPPPPRTELGCLPLWLDAAARRASVAVCCSWPMASAPEPIITTNAAIAAAGRSQAAARTGSLPLAGRIGVGAVPVPPNRVPSWPRAGRARPATGQIRLCARPSRRRSQGTASRRRSMTGSVQETIQAAITGRGGVSRARIRPRPSAAGSIESAAARSALRSRSS